MFILQELKKMDQFGFENDIFQLHFQNIWKLSEMHLYCSVMNPQKRITFVKFHQRSPKLLYCIVS